MLFRHFSLADPTHRSSALRIRTDISSAVFMPSLRSIEDKQTLLVRQCKTRTTENRSRRPKAGVGFLGKVPTS